MLPSLPYLALATYCCFGTPLSEVVWSLNSRGALYLSWFHVRLIGWLVLPCCASSAFFLPYLVLYHHCPALPYFLLVLTYLVLPHLVLPSPILAHLLLTLSSSCLALSPPCSALPCLTSPCPALHSSHPSPLSPCHLLALSQHVSHFQHKGLDPHPYPTDPTLRHQNP